MKYISNLLIITILSLTCAVGSAQENPFMEMAGKRYAEYSQEFLDRYVEFMKLDTAESQKVIRQIEAVAKKTGGVEWKLCADYFKLELFGRNRQFHENEQDFSKKLLKDAFELLEKIEKANVPHLELMLRQKIIDYYWIYFKNYEAAFEQYVIQDERLGKISSDDVPEKAKYYIQIADAYYFFKDYAHAISYYRAILKEKENTDNQSSQQNARNGLGLCFRNTHDFDSSDYYFHAIMQVHYLTPNETRYHEIWDGIAEGSIGHNMFLRGEYDDAIPLLKNSIEKMLKYNDYGFTSGPTINLAEIYLIQNNLSGSKQYIDSARKYNALMPRYGILPRIYEVLSKYYTETGNKKLSIAYMDSALQANKEHEEEFNAMLLLRMEQKESARRQQELIREKEIRRDVQIRLLMISGGFVVISILSVLLFVFYRRKRRAYLGLYHQIKEQDRLAEELNAMTKQYEQMEQSMPKAAEDDGDEDGDEDDIETLRAVQTLCTTSLPGNRQQRELVSRLREFLLKDNYFATFDIDIQELIPEMATNRAYFFKALKTVTGKTPMEFINDLRLDEAKRLLDNTNLTIETIAFECGFNTVRTFYRQFRDRYSITPAEYRNMAEVVSG